MLVRRRREKEEDEEEGLIQPPPLPPLRAAPLPMQSPSSKQPPMVGAMNREGKEKETEERKGRR
jgi:hypothetical protein